MEKSTLPCTDNSISSWKLRKRKYDSGQIDASINKTVGMKAFLCCYGIFGLFRNMKGTKFKFKVLETVGLFHFESNFLLDIRHAHHDMHGYFDINMFNIKNNHPLKIKLKLNEVDLNFMVDTGACMSLIPLSEVQKMKTNMQPCDDILTAISGPFPLVGKITVALKHNDQLAQETFGVVDMDKVLILGRPAIRNLNILDVNCKFSNLESWRFEDCFESFRQHIPCQALGIDPEEMAKSGFYVSKGNISCIKCDTHILEV